jgi:hypothetical protein
VEDQDVRTNDWSSGLEATIDRDLPDCQVGYDLQAPNDVQYKSPYTDKNGSRSYRTSDLGFGSTIDGYGSFG